MTPYMLDANICIYLLARVDPALNVMLRMQTGRVTISSIVYAELCVGARNDLRDDAFAKLALLTAEMPVVAFDAIAAEGYGVLRRKLERVGTRSFDLLIAAHALSRRATLVTNNEADFTKFDGLTLANWTSG